MKKHSTIDRLESDLQDLKDRLHCKPKCVYEAHRYHIITEAVCKLEAILSHANCKEASRVTVLLAEFKKLAIVSPAVLLVNTFFN